MTDDIQQIKNVFVARYAGSGTKTSALQRLSSPSTERMLWFQIRRARVPEFASFDPKLQTHKTSPTGQPVGFFVSHMSLHADMEQTDDPIARRHTPPEGWASAQRIGWPWPIAAAKSKESFKD
ncbi:hypothetical protein [Methylobacterium sp. P5_C11]